MPIRLSSSPGRVRMPCRLSSCRFRSSSSSPGRVRRPCLLRSSSLGHSSLERRTLERLQRQLWRTTQPASSMAAVAFNAAFFPWQPQVRTSASAAVADTASAAVAAAPRAEPDAESLQTDASATMTDAPATMTDDIFSFSAAALFLGDRALLVFLRCDTNNLDALRPHAAPV